MSQIFFCRPFSCILNNIHPSRLCQLVVTYVLTYEYVGFFYHASAVSTSIAILVYYSILAAELLLKTYFLIQPSITSTHAKENCISYPVDSQHRMLACICDQKTLFLGRGEQGGRAREESEEGGGEDQKGSQLY